MKFSETKKFERSTRRFVQKMHIASPDEKMERLRDRKNYVTIKELVVPQILGTRSCRVPFQISGTRSCSVPFPERERTFLFCAPFVFLFGHLRHQNTVICL